MTLDVAWAERWTRLSAERIAAARDELTELDRQIGDGDHGENLDRGFRAVVAKLDGAADGEQPPGQIGDVLKLVATTLMSSVGGASGPLYGTAYLRAAKVTGLAELDAHGVVALLEGALEGISARGKAQVGEKTMVDAWQPAVDAAEAAADAGGSTAGVVAAGARAARAGAAPAAPRRAAPGRGRARGERSAGHQDPGATSTAILLEAARDAAAA